MSEAVVQGCSVKQMLLGNFVKFTGKHLCQGLFFNKVACEFCEISKNTFFHRTAPVAASEMYLIHGLFHAWICFYYSI